MQETIEQRTSVQAPSKKRTFKDVPKGLWGLSFVEMWERYSFYGLQAILMLYAVSEISEQGLGLSAAAAGGIVGGYGGAVYLTQLLGAWFGERVIAPKHMVLIGATVIAIGHVVLAAVPGLMGLGLGLGLIVLGTGALKTNITAIVGNLYDGRSGEERDAGFSYFYTGISVGAVLGPLTSGFAQSEWGFHWGFGVAAVIMFAGLFQYLVLMKKLPKSTEIIQNPLSPAGRVGAIVGLLGGLLVLVLVFWTGILPPERLSLYVSTLIIVAAIVYFVIMLRSQQITPHERQRVIGFIPYFIGASAFFGLLFQIFTTAPLMAREIVDLEIGDWSFPVGWIPMLTTGATAVFSPVFAALWMRMGARQPKAPGKVALGLIGIAVCYIFFAILASVFADSMIPLVLMLITMVGIGITEIFVGPIGLSLATLVGPKKFQAQLVGLNFLTLALGSSLAGQLAYVYTVMGKTEFFLLNAGVAGVIGLALVLARGPINRSLYAGL